MKNCNRMKQDTARSLPLSNADPSSSPTTLKTPPSPRPTGGPVARPSHLPCRVGDLNPMALLRATSQPLNVGTFNVRTFTQPGQPELLANTLSRYDINVCCLQELRLPLEGSCSINSNTGAHFQILHSGAVNGLYGVGFALNKAAQQALLDFKVFSERLAVITLAAKPINISILSIYAPVESAPDADKDAFYHLLNQAVVSIPRKNFILYGGDFNAHLGVAADLDKPCVGPFTIGQRNSNGDKLLEFLHQHSLAASNTCFQHRRSHLRTWRGLSGLSSQIDFILVKQRWRRTITNCRSYWGTDLNSDHALVRASLKLKFIHRPRPTITPKINVSNLKEPVSRSLYRSCLQRRIRSRSPSPTATVSEIWQDLKEDILNSALESLGTQRAPRHQDWISAPTQEVLEYRRTRRHDLTPAALKKLNRNVRRCVTRDRELFWEQQAEELDTAMATGNTGKAFQLLRKAAGKRPPGAAYIQSQTGQRLLSTEQRADCFKSHFNALLNHPPPQQPAACQDVGFRGFANINEDPPSRNEILAAISKLKNGKAAGEDGIQAEMLKAGGADLVNSFYHLFLSIFQSESIPAHWETAILIPVPKKGNAALCENYRGISLLNVALKVLESIILDRIRPTREVTLRENQAGFRPGRSCVDQIFALRQIIQKRHEFRQPTFIAFIDFKAAFDSIDRRTLYEILDWDGIPAKLLAIIKSMYARTLCRVRVGSALSKEFEISTGVRQGGKLSPELFNADIDWVMRTAITSSDGVPIGTTGADSRISDLDYADDVAVLETSAYRLQRVLNNIERQAALVGLKINSEKTKIMVVASTERPNIYVNGRLLECVDTFTYLGSVISSDNDATCDVRSRIGKATAAFNILQKPLWGKHNISLRTKLRVYNAAVQSVLLYAVETLPLNRSDINLLCAFEHRCWRRILRIRWDQFISNAAVRRRLLHHVPGKNGAAVAQPPFLQQTILRRQLSWLGHVLRMPTSRLPYVTLLAPPCPGWKRPPGGCRQTWQRSILNCIEDASDINFKKVYGRFWFDRNNIKQFEVLQSIAQHRVEWKKFTDNAVLKMFNQCLAVQTR